MILFFLVWVSCDQKVSSKDNKIEIERFEKLFYNSNPSDLTQIKNKYPFFFPDSYPDSVWLNRLQDPIQLEIFNEILMQYESVIFLENLLEIDLANLDKLNPAPVRKILSENII